MLGRACSCPRPRAVAARSEPRRGEERDDRPTTSVRLGRRGRRRPRRPDPSSATPSERRPSGPEDDLSPPPRSRRDLLRTAGIFAAASAAPSAFRRSADAAAAAVAAPPSSPSLPPPPPSLPPSYAFPGPYSVARLPVIEHVCHRLSPACVGKQCAVTLEFLVPRMLQEEQGGDDDDEGVGESERSKPKARRVHVAPPQRAPLAILSGGFLVGRQAYSSTARHLCSWGFAVATYDKAETALDPLDDVVSSSAVLEIADFVGSSPALSRLIDSTRLYLVGHSRGGKLSVLAAARDGGGDDGGGAETGTTASSRPPPSSSRVKALGLIDPVNNTVYAPQGPRYPSATAALRGVPSLSSTPLLAIGSGPSISGKDCAPTEASAPSFYEAARRNAPAWLATILPSGHFQFLDEQSAVQRAVCASGPADDEAVRACARAALACWGRVSVFGDGRDSASPPSLTVSELLERTERDMEELLRDGTASGGDGSGGRYSKKLRSPPFLSSKRKHLDEFPTST